jgi:serine O-acetyltransferase
VGIPGRVVEGQGVRRDPSRHSIELDHADLPDPVARTIATLLERLQELETRVGRMQASAATDRHETAPAGQADPPPGALRRL